MIIMIMIMIMIIIIVIIREGKLVGAYLTWGSHPRNETLRLLSPQAHSLCVIIIMMTMMMIGMMMLMMIMMMMIGMMILIKEAVSVVLLATPLSTRDNNKGGIFQKYMTLYNIGKRTMNDHILGEIMTFRGK